MIGFQITQLLNSTIFPRRVILEPSTDFPIQEPLAQYEEDTSASTVLQMVPLISLQNAKQPSRRRPGISLGQDVKLASCSMSLRFLQNRLLSVPLLGLGQSTCALAASKWQCCVQFASGQCIIFRSDKVPQKIYQSECSVRTASMAPEVRQHSLWNSRQRSPSCTMLTYYTKCTGSLISPLPLDPLTY